jgi:hypothetical protein
MDHKVRKKAIVNMAYALYMRSLLAGNGKAKIRDWRFYFTVLFTGIFHFSFIVFSNAAISNFGTNKLQSYY